MVADALKGYIQLANGLTDVTKDRAAAAAKTLVAQSPDLLGTAASTAASVAVQVQSFAEELLVTSRDNRALLMGLIRTEVERVVTALGFAKESEVDAVRHKVDKLEEAVEGLGEDTSFATPSLRVALTPTKKSAPVKKVAAQKPGPKSATKKAPTKAAGKTPTTKSTAKTVPAKKVPAKKVPAPKPVAKKKPAGPVATPASAASAVTTPATPLVPPPPGTPPSRVAVAPDPMQVTPAAPIVEPAVARSPDIVDLTRSEATSPAGDGTHA